MSTRPRFWLRAVLALVLLLAVAAAFGWQRWRHWTPARTDYPMQGLALSAVHGVVDWGSLQTQNPDFVYVRAVNGQHGRDPAFSRNWAEAKAAGMRYGAEILFDPCFPASAQATVFVTTVPRDNAALPAAIRIDDAPACAALPGRDRRHDRAVRGAHSSATAAFPMACRPMAMTRGWRTSSRSSPMSTARWSIPRTSMR
jgi:hypothetical protein